MTLKCVREDIERLARYSDMEMAGNEKMKTNDEDIREGEN